MKVQRVQLLNSNHITWTVLGDDYLPVQPIQELLLYLKNIERSPNTIKSYAYHLKLFWLFLREKQLEWTYIGFVELTEFVAWLRDGHEKHDGITSAEEIVSVRKETTVNTILAAVFALYDYHKRAGTTKDIPLYREQHQPRRRYKSFLHHIDKGKTVKTRVIKLKQPQCIHKTLNPDQIDQLCNACYLMRDKFLIRLLYETGMRIGQALGLRHQDIHSWDNEIKIVPRYDNINQALAKTRDSYIVHVSQKLMSLYTDYLINEFDDIDSDYVFVNIREGIIGDPLKYNVVAKLFDRLRKRTGIYAHPHMLRHTHATELIRCGWDVAKVQKRLGHKDVQTTLNIYSHLNDDDMKRAYQSYQERKG
jgi:integrase/recombinase XerD